MKILSLLALLLTISTAYPAVYLGRLKRGSDMAEIHGKAKGKAKHLNHVNVERFDLTEDEAEDIFRSGKMEFIERDLEVTLDTAPNDPLYPQLWGMHNIDAALAWDTSIGSDSIVVAVIDTGVLTTHPDLVANIWTDPITGSHGWTARNGVITEGVTDGHGHGTHCAGTIGAVGNNSRGVVGVNWRVKIAGFDFLGSGGSGPVSDAILIIDKIIELKKRGVNIRITSNSWGEMGTSEALRVAFLELEQNNILSMVAAGNSNMDIDVTPFTPAGITNTGVVSVMAIDQQNTKASFSNYGYAGVDIAAPGVGILSTCPTSGSVSDPSGYKSISGTSMSTPHVAGLAALALSVNPNLSFAELKALLLHPDSCVRLADPDATRSSTGSKISALKTLTNPFMFNPVVNRNPVLSVQYTPSATAGGTIAIKATATDPDGDAVLVSIMSKDGLFPTSTNGNVTLKAPAYAIDYVLSAVVVAADGKGGTASKQVNVNILKSPLPPVVFSIDNRVFPPPPTTPTVWGTTACLSPDSGLVSAVPTYFFSSKARIGTITIGAPIDNSCDTPDVSFGIQTNSSTWAFYAIAENSRKEMVNSPYKYVRLGNDARSNYFAPTLAMTLSKQSGHSPLTVNYDFGASSDPDGKIAGAFLDLLGDGSFRSVPMVGSVTFTNVGTHKIRSWVMDNSDFIIQSYFYVTVLENAPTPPPPPLVAPTNVAVTRSGTSYRLTWRDTNTRETNYRTQVVQAKGDTSTVMANATLPANSQSYNYTAPNPGKAIYTFRVWAIDATTNGPSASVSISSK